MNDIPVPPGNASRSRRVFLTRAAAVSLVPLAAGLLAYRQHTSAPMPGPAVVPGPVVLPRLADFVPAVGSHFVTTAEDDSPGLTLVLTKAEPGKHKHPRGGELFSLRFTAPEGHPFQSRIYHLQHAVLGSLALFISPAGSSIIDGPQQKGQAVLCLAPRQA
jgi:hypothetical protein